MAKSKSLKSPKSTYSGLQAKRKEKNRITTLRTKMRLKKL